MFGFVGALLDIRTSGIGKLHVPDQVLGAMETAPVPVRAHHGTDEVGVVLVGSSIVDEVTREHTASWGGNSSGRSGDGDERSEDFHGAGVVVPKKQRQPGYQEEYDGLIVERGAR